MGLKHFEIFLHSFTLRVCSSSLRDVRGNVLFWFIRGVEDPKGWSVDLECADWNSSLCGKDYVHDLLSELEYPPAFPLSQSSSLLTVKPGRNVPESQLKTLSK